MTSLPPGPDNPIARGPTLPPWWAIVVLLLAAGGVVALVDMLTK